MSTYLISISEKWDPHVLVNISSDSKLDWGRRKIICHLRTNFITFSHSTFRSCMFIILKLFTKVNSSFIYNKIHLKHKTLCDIAFAKMFLQNSRRAKCINRHLIELWNFTIAAVLNLLCWILILEDYQSIATGKCPALQMYIWNSMNVHYFIHAKFSIQWNAWLFYLHKFSIKMY